MSSTARDYSDLQNWAVVILLFGAKMSKKSKVLLSFFAALGCACTATNTRAQDYGFNQVPQVPQVPSVDYGQPLMVDPPSYPGYHLDPPTPVHAAVPVVPLPTTSPAVNERFETN